MAKERLDKIIASSGLSTRSEVKNLIKKGLVLVNGTVVKDSAIKFDCDFDDIVVDGKPLKKGKFVYIMLNKPKGVVSATNDNKDLTVVDILPEEFYSRIATDKVLPTSAHPSPAQFTETFEAFADADEIICIVVFVICI